MTDRPWFRTDAFRLTAFPAAMSLAAAITLLGFTLAYGFWAVSWWAIPLLLAPAGVLLPLAGWVASWEGSTFRRLPVALVPAAGLGALALAIIPLWSLGQIRRGVFAEDGTIWDPAPGVDSDATFLRTWMVVLVVAVVGFGAIGARQMARRGVPGLRRWLTVTSALTLCLYIPLAAGVGLGYGLTGAVEAPDSDGARVYLPALAHGAVPARALLAGAATVASSPAGSDSGGHGDDGGGRRADDS